MQRQTEKKRNSNKNSSTGTNKRNNTRGAGNAKGRVGFPHHGGVGAGVVVDLARELDFPVELRAAGRPSADVEGLHAVLQRGRERGGRGVGVGALEVMGHLANLPDRHDLWAFRFQERFGGQGETVLSRRVGREGDAGDVERAGYARRETLD